MIGKKEKRVGIVLLCVAHFLIYNVGILIVMDRLFGKEQWFQLLMPTCSLFLATGSVAAFSLLTKNSFFKMLLECVVADAICGVIIYICRCGICGFLCGEQTAVEKMPDPSDGTFLDCRRISIDSSYK